MATLLTEKDSEKFVRRFEERVKSLGVQLSPSSKKYLHLIQFALANEKPPARLKSRIDQPNFEKRLIDYLERNFDDLFAETVERDLKYERDNPIFLYTQPMVTFFHVQHFIDLIRVKSRLFFKIDPT
ncbi:MAG: hypothetical protein IH995_06365 [Proteobacteria bacterium]|nr:hypothetical protein [Pseudomonadota bacterium]